MRNVLLAAVVACLVSLGTTWAVHHTSPKQPGKLGATPGTLIPAPPPTGTVTLHATSGTMSWY
jgi:hypothetical protein